MQRPRDTTGPIRTLFLATVLALATAMPSPATADDTATSTQPEDVQLALERARRLYDAYRYEAALEIYVPLAEAGVAEAQYRLGFMHRMGRGVPRDFDKALEWYRRAAAQDYGAAIVAIARYYTAGGGAFTDDQPVDVAEGLRWFIRAARLAYPDAPFTLAFMYCRGLVVPEDIYLGFGWTLLYVVSKGQPADTVLGKKCGREVIDNTRDFEIARLSALWLIKEHDLPASLAEALR